MDSKLLKSILACPVCHNKISQKHKRHCKLKNKKFQQAKNIWDFQTKEQKTQSQEKNENRHSTGSWGRINDGSYEILASFARGNRTIDIACGEGWIEQLDPQTIGVDFSMSALKKAQKNGAKYLVCASAQNLPFIENSFDVAICAGSIENIEDPKKAISEMARVSKIQIMTVHREFNLPFARFARNLFNYIFKIENQPIEKPIQWAELEKLLKKAHLKTIFKGYWTLPVNYGHPIKFLPEFKNIPSCFFVITCKNHAFD